MLIIDWHIYICIGYISHLHVMALIIAINNFVHYLHGGQDRYSICKGHKNNWSPMTIVIQYAYLYIHIAGLLLVHKQH